MGVPKDLSGMRFGKLVAVSITEERSFGSPLWLCRCDCGNTTKVTSANLRSGNNKSCGCMRRDGYNKEINGLYNMNKRAAKRRGIEFSLSKDEFYKLVTSNCSYCGIHPSNTYTHTEYLPGTHKVIGTFIYTGIDRIDNTKGYIPGNCVPCCKYCNRIKSDQTLEEFSDWITRVYHGLQKWTTPPERTS